MNGKTPARREPARQEVASLRELLERQTAQFALVLPPKTVQRWMRVLMTTLNEKPELQRCNPQSILRTAMHAAADGLEIDGKEAAIIPFKVGGEQIATYLPMVQGLRKKVLASGMIQQMVCMVVYEDDPIFEIQFGSNPNVNHKPALTGGSKRKIRGAYSDVEFKNGGHSIEWMTLDQIEEIRMKSPAVKAGRDTPWKDPVFYPEMCRKTVFRRHAKMLPMASDIENVFRHEAESLQEIEQVQPTNAPQLDYSSRPASVASTLDEFGSGLLPAGETVEETSNPTVEGEQATDGQSSGETAARSSAAPQQEPAQQQPISGLSSGEVDAVKKAYRRGQDDRKAGRKRDDMPEEFAANDKNKEQVAWWCGFDGKPMPTWKAAP